MIDFISISIGMVIGIVACIIGILLKILYFRTKPYLDTLKVFKGVEFDQLYKNFMNDINKPIEEKDDKKIT
jgi:hypothetical protein